MRAVVVLLMAVAACAEPSSSPDVGVPRPTAVCPAGAPAPRAPPAPRTVDAIAQYATAMAEAHRRTEAARAECARRLRALDAWAEQR